VAVLPTYGDLDNFPFLLSAKKSDSELLLANSVRHDAADLDSLHDFDSGVLGKGNPLAQVPNGWVLQTSFKLDMIELSPSVDKAMQHHHVPPPPPHCLSGNFFGSVNHLVIGSLGTLWWEI